MAPFHSTKNIDKMIKVKKVVQINNRALFGFH